MQPATTTKAVKLDAGQLVASSSRPSGAEKQKKKRKASKTDNDDEEDSDSGSDIDFVNVDLDFFGFIEPDYQAVKNLTTQLLSHDAKELDVAGIADHLIEQEEEVGSTVKSDGELGDPLAFIGVLPWSADNPYIASLRSYLLGKISSNSTLTTLLNDSSSRIAVVLHERLVNMPVQVVPALYRTLDQEMRAAGQAFSFTHLLFISRVFLATPDDFPQDDTSVSLPSKKKKKKSKKASSTPFNPDSMAIDNAPSSDTFLYHLEDEFLAKHALEGNNGWMEFKYTNAPDKNAPGTGDDFGVETRGRVTLIERGKLLEVAEEAEKMLAA